MPYSLPNNIPEYIKNLPVGAQRIFVDVFNSAMAEHKSEEEARQAAWGAVKNAYEKRGEEWVKKAKEVDMSTSLAEAYALHNQLHLDFANIQLGARRKAEIQGRHATLVNDIVAEGGVHVAKDKDMLDETLPYDLKGTIKARYVAPIGVATLTLADGGGATSRVQVLRTGTFYHPVYGKFTITATDLAAMVHNYKMKRPKEPTEMVVDYEHMSAPGQAPQPAPAAGWVKGVEQDGDELFCFVDWTAKAADAIKNREYRFISPEFTLSYRDKETNKPIGPTLLAVALTNRPFLEGMEPVTLSEEVAAEVLALSERTIQNYTQFDKAEEALLVGTAADAAILLADWDTQYINDLPDNAFALIRPGGEKDDKGKTVPRSLRFLPYKNMDGSINLPHLRNALARLDQTSLTPEEKAHCRNVLEKAAKAEGVGEENQKQAKEVLTLDEAKVRELLGIGPEDSIEEAITALKAKITEAEGKAEEASTKAEAAQAELSERNAKDANAHVMELVDKAITDKKLLPKQKDAAVAMCLKDEAGFTKLMAEAPVIGPETHELGNAGNNLEVTITASERKIAAQMGVKEEDIVKQKQADAAAVASAAS